MAALELMDITHGRIARRRAVNYLRKISSEINKSSCSITRCKLWECVDYATK